MKKKNKKPECRIKKPKAVEADVYFAPVGETPTAPTNFNNIITASRMMSMMQCPRKHFWSYEIGLRKREDSIALRIGSAWARAMECRWNGGTYDDALAAGVPEGCGFDEHSMAIISGLLAAYYDHYGQRETFGKMNPEVQFRSELENGWTAEGKIDGLGELRDGRSAIVESKTTSDSIAPDSTYWQRLYFNAQVLNYIVESRKLGWDIATCFYDVTRKPMIQPKEVNDLDSDGLKIVLDAEGNRVYLKQKTENDPLVPRQSGDVGKRWTVKSHIETAEQFCDRLYKDALSRPDFYFIRREIPVIDQQIESFEHHRNCIINLIQSCRKAEDTGAAQNADWTEKRDPEAWPRNICEHTCDFCQFKTFCLQNLSVDINNPPQGFTVDFNPELKKS